MTRDFFGLLLKPASHDCNLNCRYCFYRTEAARRTPPRHMTEELLAELTRSYLTLPFPRHVFAWQGGEPTLAGLDFFRLALRLQRKFGNSGAIDNVLQTNGTLLNDEWGVFLKENRILTGISLDGPIAMHDFFRTHGDGRGSCGEVLRGLEVLKRHEVEFNVLTVVSAANAKRAPEVYARFRELGVRYQQYIECVEFDRATALQPYSLQPGQWGEFLCRLFDEWYQNDTETVSIRLFDSILSRLTTGIPTLCQMSGACDGYLVVEANGDVYPCDFFVRPELKLGNLARVSVAELRRRQLNFGFPERKTPESEACRNCRFLALCMGDCPRVRRGGKSILCGDWRMFYEHTIERFELLAARLESRA